MLTINVICHMLVINDITIVQMWVYKCFSKRVAKRIRNLQAKFINNRMTSIWMYVSVSWGAVIKKM